MKLDTPLFLDFIGIEDMPQFKPKKHCKVLHRCTSGSNMCIIEYPSGQHSEKYGCEILFVQSVCNETLS